FRDNLRHLAASHSVARTPSPLKTHRSRPGGVGRKHLCFRCQKVSFGVILEEIGPPGDGRTSLGISEAVGCKGENGGGRTGSVSDQVSSRLRFPESCRPKSRRPQTRVFALLGPVS